VALRGCGVGIKEEEEEEAEEEEEEIPLSTICLQVGCSSFFCRDNV
jgi:hypothetical protein